MRKLLLFLTLISSLVYAAKTSLDEVFTPPKSWKAILNSSSVTTDSKTFSIDNVAVAMVILKKNVNKKEIQEVLNTLKEQKYKKISKKNGNCYEKQELERFSFVCTLNDSDLVVSSISWKSGSRESKNFISQLTGAFK